MATAPYDKLEDVLKSARVRVNDAIVSIGGDILTDARGFTIPMCNNAWRRFQQDLQAQGFAALVKMTVLASVPACASSDCGSEVWINWEKCFDGNALQNAPLLPQDFIAPLILWERAHSGNGSYQEMDKVEDGLPGIPKDLQHQVWEWRGEAIRLPGSTVATDIRVRYAAFYPDFTAVNDPVPIMRALNALAWYVGSEFSKSRGDLDAGYFDTQAQGAVAVLVGLPKQSPAVTHQVAATGPTEEAE